MNPKPNPDHTPPPPTAEPKAASTGRGAALVEQMRGQATRRITTDEIMKLTRGE
jgi:hypothetical protein